MNSNFETRIGLGDTTGKPDIVAQERHGINNTRKINKPVIVDVVKATLKILGGSSRVGRTTTKTKDEILGI